MKKSSIKQDEQGIVAILVTMIIMIVLSLIVTGFAQLARREQREALDRQLATQAFYAAESGINDARRAIKQGFTTDKADCSPVGSGALSNNVVSSDGTISYSCLLIKQQLPETKHVIKPDNSRIIPINAVLGNGTSVPSTAINVRWTAQGSGSVNVDGSRALGVFPPLNAWGANNVGVLRVDVIPIPDSGLITSGALSNGMLTFFAYPTSSSTTGTAARANNGDIVAAGCGSGECRVNINTADMGTSRFYIRLKAIYNAVDVKMCVNGCGGTTLIQGAQAEVDVTGKANDVLKRIKVSISDVSDVANMTNFPENVTSSGDSICKLLEVRPGSPAVMSCTP
jgi:Tfp pilus assembly protein PilX